MLFLVFKRSAYLLYYGFYRRMRRRHPARRRCSARLRRRSVCTSGTKPDSPTHRHSPSLPRFCRRNYPSTGHDGLKSAVLRVMATHRDPYHPPNYFDSSRRRAFGTQTPLTGAYTVRIRRSWCRSSDLNDNKIK